MIRPFTCPSCEDGRVQCSRYGGNDPDVWFRAEPCEDCDGHGTIEIDDRDLVSGEIVTQHDRHWYVRANARSERAWMARDGLSCGYGSTETAAVEDLIEMKAAEADEREAERLWAEEGAAA